MVLMVMLFAFPTQAAKVKTSNKNVTTVKNRKKSFSKKEARKAYREYIASKLSSAVMYPSAKYIYFDINNDGIEELIFRYSLNDGRYIYYVLTYKGGEVHDVYHSNDSYCCYLKKGKGICFYRDGGASFGQYELNNLKGTTFKNVAFYACNRWGIHHNIIKYWKDGKELTKSQYEAAVNNFRKWKRF